MKRALISALLALTLIVPTAALAGNGNGSGGEGNHGNKKHQNQHCHAHGLVVVAVGCVNVEDILNGEVSVLSDILSGPITLEDVLNLLPVG